MCTPFHHTPLKAAKVKSTRRGSRINTDRFPKRAPKEQASSGVRRHAPLGNLFWILTPWTDPRNMESSRLIQWTEKKKDILASYRWTVRASQLGHWRYFLLGSPLGQAPTPHREMPSLYVEKRRNGGRNSQKASRVPFPWGRFLRGGTGHFRSSEVDLERTQNYWVELLALYRSTPNDYLTVEPLRNGHTGNRRRWPLWKGGRYGEVGL